MSRSIGNPYEKSISATVTSVIVLASPDTVMFDGYGCATPIEAG